MIGVSKTLLATAERMDALVKEYGVERVQFARSLAVHTTHSTEELLRWPDEQLQQLAIRVQRS